MPVALGAEGEGAPAPPLRSAPRRASRGRSALHGSGGGKWESGPAPRAPGSQERGTAGGAWAGQLQLGGRGDGNAGLAEGGVRGAFASRPRGCPKPCPRFKNRSLGISAREPGSLYRR